jgi:MFS family permease
LPETRDSLKGGVVASGENPLPPAEDRSSTFEPGSIQVVATAFTVLFCVVGLALWGLPFYYDFMVRQFGWTRSQVTSGNAISKLVIGPVFGFLAGWMVDRFGSRRLMMVGILMAGVALIGLGGVSTLGMFYFFYFFNALGYVCGGPLPNQVLLSQWFRRSRGKVMGIAYLGIGLGGASVPWISNVLVRHFGWQTALRSVGVLIIVLAFPMAFLVKEARVIRPAGKSQATPPAEAPVSMLKAFRSLPFYLLVAGSMCSVGAISGVQQNLKLFLSLDQHFTQNLATRILSLILSFSIVGRLLMGWLADRFPVKYVMITIYTLVAAAIPILLFRQTPLALYIFSAVFGIGLGGDYMIIPLMTAEIFSMGILGRILGVILTADGVAEAASPWFVGRMRDLNGTYFQGFLALVGVALLGALAVSALPRNRKVA